MLVLLQRKLEYDIRNAQVVDGRIQQDWPVGWTYICANDDQAVLDEIIARRQGVSLEEVVRLVDGAAGAKPTATTAKRKGGDR